MGELEQQLGFELYPEDETPEFYVAHDRAGQCLGVALFIDPRTKPKILDGSVSTLEVGIGVDARGAINRVRVQVRGGFGGGGVTGGGVTGFGMGC